MNKYRLPPEVYDRKQDKTVTREYIHKQLVEAPDMEIVDSMAVEIELLEADKGE